MGEDPKKNAGDGGKKAAPPKERQKGHIHRRPRMRPIFKTLAGRVRFTVMVAVLGVTLVALNSLVDLQAGHNADAAAANERLLSAVVSGDRGTLADVRSTMDTLSTDAASNGATVADCERAASAAASALPYARVGVASDTGAVLCEAGTSNGSKSIAGTAFFHRATVDGEFAVGDVTVRPDGSDEIGFAEKRGGAVAYAILPTSRFVIGGTALGKDAVAGIVDSQGAVVAAVGKVSSNSRLKDLLLSGARGTSALTLDDRIQRLYSYEDIGGGTAAPLYAYVGVPAAIAFASTELGLLRALLLGGVMMLGAAWFALLIGDFLITRRVRKLMHAMREYVAGDTEDTEGITHGLAELENVTDVFEQLALKLEDSRRTLEARVKSRTSALAVNAGMSEIEKARMEALLSSVADGIVATDEEGKISFINHVAREGMWWQDPEVVGVPVHQAFKLETEENELVDPDDWPYRKTLETGAKVTTPAPAKPYHLVRSDKTTFPVAMTVTPVMLHDEVSGTLIVFRDITDEVEFDRRKSEFISIASHQLRSPIAALKWLTDMLRKGDLGPLADKQKEWVDKIFTAAEKMNLLVNELLNVSRMESGVTRINLLPTDTLKFIKDTMTETEALLAEKKQKFVFDEKELPQVVMDPLMMGEVLKNFISNASKYSPDGSDLVIAAEVQGDMIRMSVKDQGIGIPKSDQKQMFNKFFRARNAAESTIKGTGLGLYMAKSTVEMHGGEIGFDSEGEGKGSTFWFRIPIMHDIQKKEDEKDEGGKDAPKAGEQKEEKK